MNTKSKKSLSDFSKEELRKVEYYNRCYSEMNLIKKLTKEKLIYCILEDMYVFEENGELRNGDEDEIVDYILKYKINE